MNTPLDGYTGRLEEQSPDVDQHGNLQFADKIPALVKLDDYGLFRLVGSDAANFLQDHLTNDVEIMHQHPQLTAYCNPKGRMIALFQGGARDNTYYLFTQDKSLLDAIATRWQMIAKMPKPAAGGISAGIKMPDISIENLSEAWQVVGLLNLPDNPRPGTTPDISDHCVELPVIEGSAQLLAAHRDHLGKHLSDRYEMLNMISETFWQWIHIRAGIPGIVGATSEKLVPQMANLHVLDGINFKKGCYPGQEIVARMQYLGKLKRSMYRLQYQGRAVPPGTVVTSGKDADAGVVIAAATVGETTEVLAVLKNSLVDSGADAELKVEGVGELQLADLPYSLESQL